ncbi:hypothetical protein BKA93DRAFT_753394 [Sparassis latifolia]
MTLNPQSANKKPKLKVGFSRGTFSAVKHVQSVILQEVTSPGLLLVQYVLAKTFHGRRLTCRVIVGNIDLCMSRSSGPFALRVSHRLDPQIRRVRYEDSVTLDTAAFSHTLDRCGRALYALLRGISQGARNHAGLRHRFLGRNIQHLGNFVG